MRWTRKELKKRGRNTMAHNYWRILGVILIVSFVLGGFHLDLEIGSGVTAYKRAHMEAKSLMEGGGSRFGDQSSIQVVNDFINESLNENDLYDYAQRHYKPTNGVFASIYNQAIGAKSFMIGMLNGINNIAFKGRVSIGHVMILGALLMLVLWIFIGTPLIIGKHRFMLETRSYYETPIGRILFPWRVRNAKHVSWVMLVKQFYFTLWCFTIVGGAVKYYSYKMVPFILAENPEISCTDAIRLSEKMMKGQRWNAFVLDLSYIGWHALGLFTFGVLDWALINPYKEATYVELYLHLRNEAKMKAYDNAELLFDEYIGLNPIDGTYPLDEYPLSFRVSKKWIKLNYDRKYSIWSLILLFFTFSFIGWAWEVLLHVYEDGMFVNRGIMHGPWLPIYGCGGVMVIVALKRFIYRPGLTFALAVLLCGIMEYTTATILWETQHAMWWEYTGYFLNIKGRVCAEGLLLFGIGAMAFIYILGPFFDALFKRIPRRTLIAICCILMVIFTMDLLYTIKHPNKGMGITEYKNVTMKLEINNDVNYIVGGLVNYERTNI